MSDRHIFYFVFKVSTTMNVLLACWARVLVFSFLVGAVPSHASEPQETPTSCSSERAKLLSELPPNTYLALALRANLKGEIGHEDWMDELKKIGVRRIDLEFGFEPAGGESFGGYRLTLTRMSYYGNYEDPLHPITQPILVRLHKNRVISRVANSAKRNAGGRLFGLLTRSNIWEASGTLVYTVFDSECLPTLLRDVQLKSGVYEKIFEGSPSSKFDPYVDPETRDYSAPRK